MIIVAIVISILFIGILTMLIKAYYNDIVELEHRMLVLEKRDAEKLSKKEFDGVYDYFCDSINQNALMINKIMRENEKTNKKNKRNISKNS